MSIPREVSRHRKAIDRIDADILKLLSSRAKEVHEIGKIKQAHEAPIRVPEREKLLLDRLKLLNTGSYSTLAIESIYREIISASLALEAPLRIAYLGPPGTFSHQAALAAFGHSAGLDPQTEFRQIFEEVEKGAVSYGVIPIENSVEGMVYQTLDLLLSHQLSVCAEIYLPIRHCFLTACTDLSQVKTIYTIGQAWGQCSIWLKSQGFDSRHFEEVSSTARAAQMVRKRAAQAAAIASRQAAHVYGLPLYKDGIQDSAGNETRFLVVGFDKPAPTGHDKTTLAFQVEDRVGVLASILNELSTAGINLSKIESRPNRTKDWEYLFYIDVEGHITERRVSKALEKIKKYCTVFRHLGSYPRYRSDPARTPAGRLAKTGTRRVRKG